MTTYLVDFENTSHHGLEGYEKLTGEDTVVVFLGARSAAASIPIEAVMRLTAPGFKPRLLWKRSKKTAKNYLDMQLVSYLGSLIGDPSIDEHDYVIVSKDQDFLAAVDFWAERKREISIILRPTIAVEGKPSASLSAPDSAPARIESPAAAKKPLKSPPASKTSETTKKSVRAAVKDLGLKPSHYTVIYTALTSATNPQELHTALTKGLQANGPEAYRRVKHLYAVIDHTG